MAPAAEKVERAEFRNTTKGWIGAIKLTSRGEVQPVDAVRGTGIGLSIVREYVQAHGGRVDLLSDGPGAHFRIELPHATD